MTKGMPWQKWDLDDWCDDTEFKLCSLKSQGLLPRLMQVMSRSKPYGHLLISGHSPRIDELSRALGIHHKTVKSCLKELEDRKVLKRNEHGLYSQRMLLDRDKWLKSHEAGLKGGNPALVNGGVKAGDKGKVNPPLKPEEELRNKSKNKEEEQSYVLDKDFEKFWSWYPRKINRSKAIKVWGTRLKEGIKPPDLISASENYADYTKDKEKQFIMHPATFLGPSRAYEDFVNGYPDEEEGGEDIAEKIRRSQERVRGGKDTGERGRTSEPPY